MNDLEMATTLREAVRILHSSGWRQGVFGYRDGPHCALGAIASALGRESETAILYGPGTPELQVGALVAERLLGVADSGLIPEWNDAGRRTKAEVVALFETVAHDLELRHQIATTPVDTTVPTLAQITQPSKEAVSVG